MAAEEIERELKGKKIKLVDLYKEESFEETWKILGNDRVQKIFYPSDAPRKRFQSIYEEYNSDSNKLNELYTGTWRPVCELFRVREKAIKIDSLIYKTFDTQTSKRPVVIIDLSREMATGLFWNDTIQALIIKRLLDGLTYLAEDAYKQKRVLNTLVILDEAHRLAPREKIENEAQENVRTTLLNAARTTRKYGLGWMFITQTLSSLHRGIIDAGMRIFFFGFGLATGHEFVSLKEFVGGDPNAIKLYQSFRDPHSAFDIASRQYAFMTIGPVSPLSFAGTPLFLTVYNTPEEFLKANQLLRSGN